jgi:L-fuconolactonase
VEDYLADVDASHNIVATVYVETQAFSREQGPEWLRPIGEVEFANGVAAMCATGHYGRTQVNAGDIEAACIVEAAEVGRRRAFAQTRALIPHRAVRQSHLAGVALVVGEEAARVQVRGSCAHASNHSSTRQLSRNGTAS